MGLDMYLNRKHYIGANYEHNNVKGTIELTKGKENKPVKIKLNRVTSIEEEIMYWRKANHIHKWFVDNCQDGEDDCRNAYVSADQIRELIDICKKVSDNHELADELLPTESGFFFGNTDFDEYYFESLKDTIETLESALLEDPNTDYEYSSSW